MPRKRTLKPEQRLALRLYYHRLEKGDEVHQPWLARQVVTAKRLLEPKSLSGIELPETRRLTADVVIACLEAMFEQGANVLSLGCFLKDSSILESFMSNPEGFTAPDWLMRGAEPELPEGF